MLWLVLVPMNFRATASDVPAANPKTILVLGDSLAAGYGLDLSESYPAVLQKKIKDAGWNFTVINMPPLNSIPYFGPPCAAMLTRPATLNATDARMNGHFHFRKSKFVCLNISIGQLPTLAPSFR